MGQLVLLATTGTGIARASAARADGAWTVERSLSDHDVRCLAAAPLQPRTIYAGTQGAGVLRSDDGGLSWQPSGLAGQFVKSLAVSRVAPGTIYAGMKPALVYVSRDGGASWQELSGFRRIRSRRFWFSPAEKPFSAYVQALALSPDDPDQASAATRDGRRSLQGTLSRNRLRRRGRVGSADGSNAQP